MRNPIRMAVGLWLLLAIVVFNVKFDWDVRAANRAFVESQIVRHRQGLPTLTINDGFRPMVRGAARHAAVWLVGIAAAGTAAAMAAGRGDKAL